MTSISQKNAKIQKSTRVKYIVCRGYVSPCWLPRGAKYIMYSNLLPPVQLYSLFQLQELITIILILYQSCKRQVSASSKYQMWDSILVVTLLRGKSLPAMDDNGTPLHTYIQYTHTYIHIVCIHTYIHTYMHIYICIYIHHL